MLAPVDVRTELAALLRQLTDAGQREYLKAAAVCQHGPVETVETVQAAGLFQHRQPGTQIQVVRISQDYLRLDVLLQLARMDALHAAQRTDRHEDRCLYASVVRGDFSGPCGRTGVRMLKFKCHFASADLSASGFNEKSTGWSTFSSRSAKRNTSSTFSTKWNVSPST